jgi:hypothetical protein
MSIQERLAAIKARAADEQRFLANHPTTRREFEICQDISRLVAALEVAMKYLDSHGECFCSELSKSHTPCFYCLTVERIEEALCKK